MKYPILLLLTALATPGGIRAADDARPHAPHHELSAEQLAELRAKIPLFREYSDEEIAMGMSRMNNDWGWVSQASGPVGILALAHGFNDQGNAQFVDAFGGIGARYPTVYAFGMAMMSSDHIRSAVAALEGAGAERILVLPVTTADRSTLVRQWDYIFGREAESAYLDVPRVEPTVSVSWADTPTAHPVVGDILLDHALEISEDPANELVIIMGHGPQSAEDNAHELAILEKHASHLEREGGFMDVKFANVQDDAPRAVRSANVEMIRDWARAALEKGRRVLVVHTALTQSGVVGRMRRDVEGVAEFNGKGLMQHPRFGEWIEAAISPASSTAPQERPQERP